MVTQDERWIELDELERWLRTPMLVLSFGWLVIVVLELIGETNELLTTVGTMIWIVFIIEFLIRFALAPEKRPFLRTNWLTIIALVVPALRLVRVFAILRAARLLRGLRLVRIVGTANRGMNALRSTLARRRFGYVAGLTMLVIALGSAGMLSFESAGEVEGGFISYWDALWWTAMLLTSIGSEYWPVTTEGRLLCVLLSIYGFAVFGYLTATLASFFIGRDAEQPEGPVAGSGEMAELKAELQALRLALERSGRISD
ncbi:potassium channel family protein [Altericroceibacterium xinjiangense]|uniref:potassium channel family protein n=1 Tax=Altericroceibacterium xinjiangense TaxID=762261 RepID=UPI000F7DE4BA|nr:potassium channel family protein [Altericroceibacterium xinjiangense]